MSGLSSRFLASDERSLCGDQRFVGATRVTRDFRTSGVRSRGKDSRNIEFADNAVRLMPT